MSRAMGSHQSHRMGTDVWLTPPHVLDALGPFDLDPCSSLDRPWGTATRHYTIEDDGLAQDWAGRVWCNPPYGQQAWTWLERLADHGQGTALIFARTETAGFFRTVWRRASALLFLEGRLHFHHPDGTRAPANAGAPSVLVAYGDDDAHRLATCGLPGAYVDLRPANTHHGHRRNPTHQHRATKEDTMSITEKQLAEIKGRIVEGRRVPPFDVRDLADEVTRLRDELVEAREVTEDKVERAKFAFGAATAVTSSIPIGMSEHTFIQGVSIQHGYAIRIALHAALGGGDDA